MYISPEALFDLLVRKGLDSAEARVKQGKFHAFQCAMRQRMAEDPARELLSLETLVRMVRKGCAPIPGVYCDMADMIELDRPARSAICRGYAGHLEQFPSFDVGLSNDTPQFLSKLCWHIKQGRHILIQTWAGAIERSLPAIGCLTFRFSSR